MIIPIRNTNYSDKTRLIDRYPGLAKFGYHDEELIQMGFGEGYTGKVIINSAEEFVALSTELNEEIIISAERGLTPSIEIYDGWRE